ncbi:MAG: GNAT family N-acetyltransferase [Deltaproteobacteria bacterium]|nr:GNAT family N-acetyltransferase [Deltaproteobacteria bacterium]
MNVRRADLNDVAAWLALAREVEYLFGPMADESPFQEALRQAITTRTAFCIGSEKDDHDPALMGGIVISKEANEIAWLAVTARCRGKGYGRALLQFALSRLKPHESISVQTFDASVPAGSAARKLYLDLGFCDDRKGPLNPAGIPTVIMKLQNLNA